MDEKRYIFETVEITDDNGESRVVDVITDKEECYSYENLCDIAVLLNEQQATINKQLDQIIGLQDKYRILEFNHSRLEKRNKAQYEKIGEQQATISALKEENEQLRKYNELLIKQKEESIDRCQEIYRIVSPFRRE